jgi:hypothetical protein
MKKVFLLFFLFITACGKSSDEMSILEKSSCKLPCWNDIVVGQTTKGEVLKILENLPDIDSESIKNTNRTWDIFDDQITFSFHQDWSFGQQSRLRGYAYIKDNIISVLLFCGEINTTMNVLVKAVGEPEYIISGNDYSGGRLVILIQSKTGVSYSYTTELSNLEINPDTQIDCVQSFDPSLFEKMLEAKLFSGGYYNAEETLRVMYPWDGYGNLDEKYPPRQP